MMKSRGRTSAWGVLLSFLSAQIRADNTTCPTPRLPGERDCGNYVRALLFRYSDYESGIGSYSLLPETVTDWDLRSSELSKGLTILIDYDPQRQVNASEALSSTRWLRNWLSAPEFPVPSRSLVPDKYCRGSSCSTDLDCYWIFHKLYYTSYTWLTQPITTPRQYIWLDEMWQCRETLRRESTFARSLTAFNVGWAFPVILPFPTPTEQIRIVTPLVEQMFRSLGPKVRLMLGLKRGSKGVSM